MAGEEDLLLLGPSGPVSCASWIRRRRDGEGTRNHRSPAILVLMGRSRHGSCPALLELYSFDPKSAALSSDPMVRVAMPEDAGDPKGFSVHPAGEEFICATTKGCRLFKLANHGAGFCIVHEDKPNLHFVGLQKCSAFSTDGSKFAIGGEDGRLRMFNWPSLEVILDEPRAHKSFRDMDISLDSAFLVSTSTDGSARIWNTEDGSPIINLTRSAEEKILLCRFSRDGSKPFLFCTVDKGGGKHVVVVWNMSDWTRIGYKRLLGKPVSVLSTSLDGKYLALGSTDGDFVVADVKKMAVSHMSKKIHLRSPITSIEFCPTERVVISTSSQWGATVTKLTVPTDWKEWQIWAILLALFLASALVAYVLYEHSDSFWNFPLGRQQPSKPWLYMKDLPDTPPDDGIW